MSALFLLVIAVVMVPLVVLAERYERRMDEAEADRILKRLRML